MLVAIIFLAAGLWKITDLYGAAARLAQARVPEWLSVFTAATLGILETFTGIAVLVPRWRRIGGALATCLLAAFMIFIGIHYTELRGAECNCFPWIKRAVGPGFFIGDAIMMGLAILAAALSRPLTSLRGAAVLLAGVCVFCGLSFAANPILRGGARAPDWITAENGQRIPLQSGKIFIFFFNPQCLHCRDAGLKLAALPWADTKLIAVPTENPRFADWFMGKAGLKGISAVSDDLDVLKKTFPFDTPPAGVILEDGREKAMLLQFEGDEPAKTLRHYGLVR